MSPTTLVPQPPETRVSALAVWLLVRKHWLLVACVTLLVGAGTAFYTLGQTRIYQTKATVCFDPNVPRPLGPHDSGATGDASSYWNNREYYTTQNWMIRSMRVATEVVRNLELNKDPSFRDNLPRAARTGAINDPVEETALRLLRRLDVEPVRESRLTTVTFRDADPARAQQVLAAIVDTYTQTNLDEVFEASTTAADWLRGQVGALRTDLESSELALHQFKKDRNILSVSMDDQSNMLRGEMTQLNGALTEVRTRREAVQSRLVELRKIPSDDPEVLPARELMESGTLTNLRSAYVDAKRELQSLRAEGKGEKHPLTLAALARADLTRAALLAEVKNIQESCARDVDGLDQQIRALRGLYDAAEKRALDLNLMEIEYGRLHRAKETNEKLFSLVIERSKETDLSRLLRINNVRVVDRPLLPKVPVTPNVPLNVAGGIAAGLVLGLVLAIAREQMDRTLNAPEEVERELGAALLGVLPEAPNAAQAARHGHKRRSRKPATESQPETPIELAVHQRSTSGMAEAARAVRTNLVFMSPDKPHRTLLITSAAPAEGKTTVACTIAITIAQAGQRVVIVDCDMRRPRLHSIFGRSNDVGITSALLEPDSDDPFVFETQVPNLWVAPTGPLPPNPSELLHSKSFRKVLTQLAQRFDHVIIDSPPIAPVTDATVLSTLVDGVVVVVRSSRTPKDLVRRALKSLGDVSSRIVGVILNAADVEGSSYGAYQYYSYRREGYYSARPDTADRSEHVGSA